MVLTLFAAGLQYIPTITT